MDIDFNNLHLTEPTLKYVDSFRMAISEYSASSVEDFGYPKMRTRREVNKYLKITQNLRRGIGVPEGHVPSSAFWLTDGIHYLGEGHIRHILTDKLKRFGGNIGYSIRPCAWGRGLGTIQLSLLLAEAKKLHILKPIITCYDANEPSARIIEKNGGILLKKIDNKINGKQRLTRIYQIDLTMPPEYVKLFNRSAIVG